MPSLIYSRFNALQKIIDGITLRTLLLFTTYVSVFGSHLYSQNTVHVPTDYETIQEALDGSEQYDTILVAPGTYFENLEWPQAKDLHLISAAGPDSTIIDGNGVARVLDIKDLTDRSLLDGFTIQHGYKLVRGAGLYVENSGLDLQNLILTDNVSSTGAGAYLRDHSGNIDACKFINNRSANNFYSAGLGLFLDPESDIKINSCAFTNNTHSFDISGGTGGGLNIESRHAKALAPLVLIKNCTFSQNVIAGNGLGAGLYVDGEFDPIELRIDSCSFTENSTISGVGGGVAINSDVSTHISNSVFFNNNAIKGSALSYAGITNGNRTNVGSKIISNCILKNNTSNANFGSSAIYLFHASDFLLINSEISYNEGHSLFSNLFDEQNTVDIINSTFAYNTSGIYLRITDFSMIQSILWNNNSQEIESPSWGESLVEINNSIVKGGYSGTNVIDSDPLFISTEELIPTENSPCLNDGDPSLGVSTDLLGNPRPMPIGTNPDIGAYEINQPIESSTENKTTKTFKAFPNPTIDIVHFSETMDIIEVHTSNGLMVERFYNKDKVSLQHLSEGVYIFHLYEGDTKQIEKIIITK